MAITFSCGHCGKSLTTSDDKAGRKAKCPGCGETISVPEPDMAADDEDEDLEDDDDDDLPPPPPRRSSGSGETKTCPMCGAKNSLRASSCQACGEEFEDDEPRRRRGSGKRQHEIIDAGDVLSATWRIFQQNWGVLVGAVMTCLAIALLAYGMFFGIAFAVLGGRPPNRDAELVINLISLPLGLVFGVLFTWLNAGVNRLLLAVARGDDATVGLVFSGGPYTLRAFLIGFLFNLITTFGMYCCLVPGILFWLMLWPYLYLIVDEDCAGMESLSRASQFTSKNWLSVFLLVLVNTVVGGLVMATCVGIPFAMAFNWLTFAVAYGKMTGQSTSE